MEVRLQLAFGGSSTAQVGLSSVGQLQVPGDVAIVAERQVALVRHMQVHPDRCVSREL